ncbi:MAG: TonB-dependent siderophore receptor [Steroidobacteraceae bacterium]
MLRIARWRECLGVVLLVCAALAVAPLAAAADPPVAFNISAQPLPAALHVFARQAHVQLLFDYRALQHLKARRVAGRMGAEAALQQLLSGSGFTFVRVNARTIAIRRANTAESSSPPQTTDATTSRPPPQAKISTPRIRKRPPALQTVLVEARFISNAGFSAMKMNLPAKDTPFSISTYTQSFMHAIEAQQVSSLYSYMTGIQSAGSTGYDIVFRGFQSGANDQNSILVDGLPGLATRFGSPVTIGIQRIDVVRGPASVLNGEEQPGGFINLVTKKPQPHSSVELSAIGNTYDGHGVGVTQRPGFTAGMDATGPIAGNKHFLYRLIFSDQNADTYRTYAYNRDIYLAPSFTWRISQATKLTLQYVYQALHYSYDSYLVAPNNNINLVAPITTRYQQPNDYGKEHGSVLSMFFVHRFTNGWTWHLETRDVWHTDEARGFDMYAISKNLQFIQRRARGQLNQRGYHYIDTHLEMKFNTFGVTHQMVVGLTGGRDSAYEDRTQFFNAPATGPDSLNISIYNPSYANVPALADLPLVAPGHDTLLDDRSEVIENFGAYMADELSFSRHWKGSVGLRYAYDKQWLRTFYPITGNYAPETVSTAHDVLPMGGIVYQPDKHWSLYASYSTSFEPSPSNAISIDGTSNFVPTSATQYEVGAKDSFLHGRFTSTLALFRIDEKNTFSHFACANYGSCYEQVGRAQSKGAEFEVNARPLPNWQITAGAAYTRAQITQSTDSYEVGLQLPNVPRMAEHLWSRYQFSSPALRGFGIGLGIIHDGQRNGISPTTAEPMLILPAYTRVDTALYYVRSRYTLTFKVTNLLDATYYQSSGFTDNLNVLPGAPRTFTLAARVYLR